MRKKINTENKLNQSINDIYDFFNCCDLKKIKQA